MENLCYVFCNSQIFSQNSISNDILFLQIIVFEVYFVQNHRNYRLFIVCIMPMLRAVGCNCLKQKVALNITNSKVALNNLASSLLNRYLVLLHDLHFLILCDL